jgi:hypothetical protein
MDKAATSKTSKKKRKLYLKDVDASNAWKKYAMAASVAVAKLEECDKNVAAMKSIERIQKQLKRAAEKHDDRVFYVYATIGSKGRHAEVVGWIQSEQTKELETLLELKWRRATEGDGMSSNGTMLLSSFSSKQQRKLWNAELTPSGSIDRYLIKQDKLLSIDEIQKRLSTDSKYHDPLDLLTHKDESDDSS